MLNVHNHEICNENEYEYYTWKVIDKFFAVNNSSQLVTHQIDSFNDFILRKIDQIISGFNPIEIHYNWIPSSERFQYIMSISITNPILHKPIICEKDGSTKLMTPNDARLRNFTYKSDLYVDLKIVSSCLGEDLKYNIESKEIRHVLLGRVPIMVKSNYCILKNTYGFNSECKYDYGGYFIINGNEKVIISQDRIAENRTYVFVNNKVSTYSHLAEIRSVQENKLGVPKITTIKLSSKCNQFGRNIRVSIHHVKTDIPLFTLFKALGLNSDREIIEYIVYDLDDNVSKLIVNELKASVEESNSILCQRDALEYLSKYLNITGIPREFLNNHLLRIKSIRTQVLEREFLPHVGKDLKKKALYLGAMVNKLIRCYLGLRNYDDRDSYINKRIDTPGVLLSNLFRQYYGKVIKDMKSMVSKEINGGGWRATNRFINVITRINIYKIVKSTIIDSGLRFSLSTGNWGIKNNKNKQGVAQVLNRMTYNATISHLRRVNTPIEKSGKLVQPRKLHPTQWGVICPSECFDPDTPILLWDGTIEKAKLITEGDYLINDEGDAVEVKTTCSGFKNMYEIVPKNKNFMSYTVTDNHILTLMIKKELSWFDKKEFRCKHKDFDQESTNNLDVFGFSLDNDNIVDITIEKYLSLPKNVQKNLYLFKSSGINWDYKKVTLDPYIFGMWLGNGFSSGYGFATADSELLDKWIEWGLDHDATIKKGFGYNYQINLCTQTGIRCNKTEQAPLKKHLVKYDLVENKHIPSDFLVNDRKIRLSVLAGLVDTDGNVRANGHEILITFSQRNYQIIYDVEFLARSLGFSCHVNDGIYTHIVQGKKRQKPYKELTITGRYLYEIPIVLPRKRLYKFNDSNSSSKFKLIPKNIQPFVGWQLKGNGRFLLGDMSVSHNTPEGSSVGLVKNMAMMANITICSNSTNARELVMNSGIVPFDPSNLKMFHGQTKVVVNGELIGIHPRPQQFYTQLKGYKRSGTIHVYTSVSWNISENEISICTEGGRCIRPLYLVENGSINLTRDFNSSCPWHELVYGNSRSGSVIEFLDVEEGNNAMIAMKWGDLHKGKKGNLRPLKYTHLEMHPSMILGVLASAIPFSDHNQAPRNCYQAAQSKQAIGIYSSNWKHRFDTVANILNYPQKPLVRPRITTILNNDALPNGMNIIVAIACYTGFNQEDSIIMNQSAVDRGMFVSTFMRTYKEQNNKNHSNGEEEFFTKPQRKSHLKEKPYNYDKINDDGFIPENTYVTSGDVIIGKCMPNKSGNATTYKDNSIPLKNNESGYIDRNCYNDRYFSNINGEGYNFAKVRIRSDRVPTIGDKFSSRCYCKDTEVLTSVGWMKFSELSHDNKVATIRDGVLTYEKPEELQSYDYDGNMYYLKSNQVDLLVTPNHRMWVRPRCTQIYREELAENIVYARRHYKKNVDDWFPDLTNCPDELIIEDGKITKFQIDNLTMHIEAWLLLFGIWIAEGYATEYQVNIAAHKDRVKDALEMVVPTIDLEIIKRKYHDYEEENNSWSIYDVTLSRYLSQFSVGSINKYLPDWVWFLDRDQSRMLIEGLLLGDGHVMKNGTRRYDTSSNRLADDFQRLCLHAGWSCNKSLKNAAGTVGGKNRQGTSIISTVGAWRLTLITTQNEPLVNKNKIPGDLTSNHDKLTQYNDKVYCCTMPTDPGHLYVRRNGIPVWSLNSGQKGTVGMMYRQEDMPFTRDGLVPDIIMNPHAIPSRMTIGQLIECIMGKVACNLGMFGDATPFTDLKVDDLCQLLEDECGMERYGNEVMYDPRTGEQINTNVFIGPTYYQRLKHMTIDKIHSRASNGPVVMLTRQPAEGRARDGGLRMGEMEIECTWSHGTMQFLKERIIECSDNYRIFACRACGLMATCNPEKKIWTCRNCGNISNFAEIRIPYSCKLLFQEISAMNLGVKMLTG